jgi:hypothetical protein
VFTVSRPFTVFDHFRVPYDVDDHRALAPAAGVANLDWTSLTSREATDGRSLTWPCFTSTRPSAACKTRRFRNGDLVLHGTLVPHDVLARALAASGRTWSPAEPLLSDDGALLGAVWRSPDGSITLPFDPDDVVLRFWRERYVENPTSDARRWARSRALRAYYAVRPLLPRSLQISMRRAASRLQRRRTFPRWPVEDSLHGFLDLVMGWAASIAGRPVPWIAPWPEGRTWALVLTHDVETEAGVARIPVLREVDRQAGHRASWNLVPCRYHVDDALVADLTGSGDEVGVHGLYHDGRDLDPREVAHRLPEMRRWAERWGAVGFRSPATRRDSTIISTLPFQYDSSSPDSDPFEPQAGGCCSWLPFRNGSVVELPITMQQDHTLFVILRARDGQPWIDKAERIRARGGMALLVTHPDYVESGPVVEAYQQFLAYFETDPGVWRPLPAEVAAWWRRREASTVEWDGDQWRVVGAAAGEAAVFFTGRSAGQRVPPATSRVVELRPRFDERAG